ncbi:MAG: rhomboid family intramembrane serine protease [Deltaproteobacteria bacterium]|nr:rhomboid family intramembrane serine protease [Deltaproteobacteria bacterium]
MIPLKDDIPSSTFPFVTISIIVINVLVFVYQTAIGIQGAETFIYRTAAIPYDITHFLDAPTRSVAPPPFTILTSMFVHGGLFHIAGNMLFLWIFGDNVEDTLGHFRFVIFYLFTGTAASLTHIIMEPASTVPMIGASGAIAGVLGAYFILFPKANIKTLIFLFFFVSVVRIPAVVFLGFWFVLQLLSSGAAGAGGIAWYAHIGGFIAGAATVLLLRPGRAGRRSY